MLYQILAFTIHGKNIKKSYKSNKFQISAPVWNEEFELPDGSYSISDIQDYFQYILKKNGGKTVNHVISIYANKIENRITFKIVLCTYVPNKSFGQLFNVSPENLIFLKTFDSEFSYIEVSFTDKNSINTTSKSISL